MHDLINPHDVEKAMNAADARLIDFISNLDEDNVLIKSLERLKISEDDAESIKQEVVYVALGLSPITEFLDNVLVNTEGDEETISFAVDFLRKNVLTSISDIINKKESHVDELSLADSSKPNINTTQGKRTSADILLKEIGVHNAPGHEHDGYDEHETKIENNRQFMPSRKDLLSEIESPTETVQKPTFALPKGKPSTNEVLQGLANAPYTLADTTKISDGEHSTTIIDPFRKVREDEKSQSPVPTPPAGSTPSKAPEIESKIISSSDPVLVPETNPVAIINDNLDKKLNEVTGSTATQSYKIASHDPYREPIEP